MPNCTSVSCRAGFQYVCTDDGDCKILTEAASLALQRNDWSGWTGKLLEKMGVDAAATTTDLEISSALNDNPNVQIKAVTVDNLGELSIPPELREQIEAQIAAAELDPAAALEAGKGQVATRMQVITVGTPIVLGAETAGTIVESPEGLFSSRQVQAVEMSPEDQAAFERNLEEGNVEALAENFSRIMESALDAAAEALPAMLNAEPAATETPVP